MIEAVFHIGMGKTGTTSIQKALGESQAALEAAGICYLGMWMDLLGPEFEGGAGFRAFARQTPEQYAALAEHFAAALEEKAAETGATRFIVSNESYLTRIRSMAPFFAALAERIDLKVLAYARPVGSWLPSACSQWGILHKTNSGPVSTLPEVAERMIRQYDSVAAWHDLLGERFELRLFDSGTDILGDFSAAAGVPLAASGRKRNARLPQSEQVMRAAFNNQFDTDMTPDKFDRMMLPKSRGDLPRALSEKFAFLFGYEQFRPVIESHAAKIGEIEERFGIDLLSAPVPPSPEYDHRQTSDEIIGALLDIVSRQSRQIQNLTGRIRRLEQKAGEE